MLGIDSGLLSAHGLVSKETARAMARGALTQAGASVAAAVTGLAGPLGDGSDTPVGTVWIAIAGEDNCREKEIHFQGTRAEIRMQAAAAVLEELQAVLHYQNNTLLGVDK
jgi:PncC family amidohydrolase